MKTLLALVLALTVATVQARDPKVVYAFKKTHVCPSTGVTSASKACPGYVVDHMIPLCLGGPDSVENMAWQEQKASFQKDALERSLCEKYAKCGAGIQKGD
jgi:hypothetical protein